MRLDRVSGDRAEVQPRPVISAPNAVRARHPSSAARPPGTLALLDWLLDDHTDAGAADALNAAGHRSGDSSGMAFARQ
jgi:hypothetical protein